MAPTLKICGIVFKFLYSGGWQVWSHTDPGIANKNQVKLNFNQTQLNSIELD